MRHATKRSGFRHLKTLAMLLFAVLALGMLPAGGTEDLSGWQRLERAGTELVVLPDGAIRAMSSLANEGSFLPEHIRPENAPSLTGLSRFMLSLKRGF